MNSILNVVYKIVLTSISLACIWGFELKWREGDKWFQIGF